MTYYSLITLKTYGLHPKRNETSIQTFTDLKSARKAMRKHYNRAKKSEKTEGNEIVLTVSNDKNSARLDIQYLDSTNIISYFIQELSIKN